MARQDAPPAGWYPDPEGRLRLRWWDGLDWSDRFRPPPSPSELERAAAAREGIDPMATNTSTPRGVRGGLPRGDVDQIISQVRQVARTEVDRAAEMFTERARLAARDAVRDVRPLVTEYTNRIFRWIRIALVLLVVAVVAWIVFEAVAQATFLEWLGDRIDAVSD
jgi:hypothetical protein